MENPYRMELGGSMGTESKKGTFRDWYLVRLSYRATQILLATCSIATIVLGVVLPQRYPTAPSDPKSVNLLPTDELDTVLFELLKVLGGAGLVAGTVGVLQQKIQRELDAKEKLGADLVANGLLRIYQSAESSDFTHRVEELISGAQYEVTAIGLGNSYLAHSGMLLRAIRSRMLDRKKLTVNVLFASPQSPALRERIREEHAYSKTAKHFVEKGWEYTFYEKVYDDLHAGELQDALERLRVGRLPFFVMSAVIRVDDIALVQPYGTPLQPGGKCPWIEIDMRISSGPLHRFVEDYITASTAGEGARQYRILLIRHGQTTFNADGKVCGRKSDPPLTDEGKRQVSELAKRLISGGSRIDFIACGTQSRHMATAKILLPERGLIPMYVNPGFDERDIGHFDGMRYEELRAARGAVHKSTDLTQLTTEWSDRTDVESDAQVLDRFNTALSEMPQSGTVAVVTSANVIWAILRKLEPHPAHPHSVQPATAALIEIDATGKFKLSQII